MQVSTLSECLRTYKNIYWMHLLHQSPNPQVQRDVLFGWQLSQYLSYSVSSCHNIDYCKLEEVIPDDTVQQS